ncbi:hypothetical protein L9F63_004187, partial [Diploptera punctata]
DLRILHLYFPRSTAYSCPLPHYVTIFVEPWLREQQLPRLSSPASSCPLFLVALLSSPRPFVKTRSIVLLPALPNSSMMTSVTILRKMQLWKLASTLTTGVYCEVDITRKIILLLDRGLNLNLQFYSLATNVCETLKAFSSKLLFYVYALGITSICDISTACQPVCQQSKYRFPTRPIHIRYRMWSSSILWNLQSKV